MKLPRPSLLTQVSGAHLVSHLHMMALPAVLPLLPGQMGVGFVELGLALSIFNVVSALVQAPLGFAVDSFGARRVLTFGLLVGSSSFLSLGLFPSYGWLLIAMGLAGFANGVYHPADYALLSTGIDEKRMGRSFSVHTFAGYLGGAIAPGLLLGIAAWQGTRLAFAAAGLAGFVAIALLWAPGRRMAAENAEPKEATGSTRTRRRARGSRVFTPAVFALTCLFVMLSFSGTSIQNFSVSALVSGYDVALALANGALTAFLFASAFGVLAGGALADRTAHHGTVAAVALAVAAALVASVAVLNPQGFLLVAILGLAGFLFGVIAPSRDMLVRAAAPVGAEGRVFGIVSTGFNIGGAVGPVLFGWLLDNGRPEGIFWSAVGFMLVTALICLLQERRSGRERSAAKSAAASLASRAEPS
jgi:FSR family fosmidomycin resistance protein-like MFS transporter